MKNWFDIIQPHADIREGDFDEAVFAADLGDVYDGTAAPDYNDPYLFLKKTYLTDGLKNLLGRVYRKLTAGDGPSVVEIQTPFGGGKTHSLVAIYHYLKHGAQIQELLPPNLDVLTPRCCVIAGNHWNPLEGRTTGGITRRTFWGEVAFQIGGRPGYEAFRQNDEARVSPGKGKLREFLQAHQPFILLFDEILEYINRAVDVRGQQDVSLGTQTFSFFQELTETVASLSRGMMVVTLPSSHLEDFGETEEESLTRLGRIFGRVESIETPVQGEEVYAVIRRRLFEEESLRLKVMRDIVHEYFQLYVQNRDDLPPKVRDAHYRERMEMAYPFHPDVIDILYEKWSTFPSFQRTRGVLRLLANVIEDLYQREANIDLVLPGDVNLAHPPTRREFLRHIGSEHEGVIGSDIAGHEAKSQSLDQANKPWRHLAQRISTAVFFHSFAADDSEKGISLPYIKLATIRPDSVPAMVTEVLQKLGNELWYLNTRAGNYYFSRIPNLNRMILDKKEQYGESYEPELKELVRAEIGTRFKAYLWPESGEGIPDNRELKLVFLHPTDDGSDISKWIEYAGNTWRDNKNTLFFALVDTGAFAKMREDVKTYLALKEIKQAVDSGEMPQLDTKRGEIDRRIQDLARDFSFDIRRMYHILWVGSRSIDLGQPIAGAETLSNWYWRQLTSPDCGEIIRQLHYRMIVNRLMGDHDTVATCTILEQFYKEPSLPVPEEPGVVAQAIQLGVKDGAFGIAQLQNGGIDPETLQYGHEIPLDAVSFEPGFCLVSRAKSEDVLAERAAAKEAEQLSLLGDEPGGTVIPAPHGVHERPIPAGMEQQSAFGTGTALQQHFRHVRLVVSGLPASKIADINRGILMPISAALGDFTFALEIDVTGADGISQSTLETRIKETIRQIGAHIEEENVE